jgi:3-oxoacyl-[acyl-carrier protein] reductase
MDIGIRGQVAVITGGGRGIGAATARMLADEGAKVVIFDKDAEPAQTIARHIVESGGEALAVAGSVVARADVESLTAKVTERFRTVHILVNNAGFAHIAKLAEMSDEQWHSVIDVHMTGAFNCVRALAPMMIAQGYGQIINISSLSVLGATNMAPYVAAKAGLLGLTRALAVELGAHAITVNAILPGYIRTERVRASPTFAVLDAHARRAQALKRDGTIDDVANAILFFASNRSGFVTGDFMYVTGGMYQLW